MHALQNNSYTVLPPFNGNKTAERNMIYMMIMTKIVICYEISFAK